MEIQRLQALLTDQDLNDLARNHVPEGSVEELQIRIEPGGVSVKGVYQLFVPVSFETLWELGVEDGKVSARLATFRTLGMPVNVLKSLIMNVIADTAKKEPWLRVEGDKVFADIDALLRHHGLSAQTRLTAIHCQPGKIIVQAGDC